MYKQAAQEGLRIQTERGPLSVEQVFTLPIPELDKLAVRLEKEYKDSGEKSFIVKRTAKDKKAKLSFDIVLDILTTKVEADDAARVARENKEHNQEIDTLIAEKKKGDLKNLSIKELEKLRK